MKYTLLFVVSILLLLYSCANAIHPNLSEVDQEELLLYDSLSEGYLSWVINAAVTNHINNYLGFEQRQSFFDTMFLHDYPKSVVDFFDANEEGFSFSLDTNKTKIITYYHGTSYLEVDVTMYNCHNLSCLYPHRILLYNEDGDVLINDEIGKEIKLGLRRIEYSFLEKGYLCDTIIDYNIPFRKSLFCDVYSTNESVFRCFFDTISISQNDYLETVIDSLCHYCNQYGLSRIVSSVEILSPPLENFDKTNEK